MRKVVEFQLLGHTDAMALCVEVNAWLQQGWELYGSPFSGCDVDCEVGVTSHYEIIQAMVRYEEQACS